VLRPAFALAQADINQAVPGAVIPGQTTEVTLHGTKLTEPLDIWTSFPAKVEKVVVEGAPADGSQLVCRFTLDAEVSPGIGGIIIATPEGVSTPFFLPIDDLPSVAEASGNESLATAQSVAIPAAVDGRSQAATSDFYSFTAQAGQRIAFEVLAQRIGSFLDPVMWLRDASGNELAYSDDDPALGADCRFSYTFPADGQYVLELRDNRFEAGHRYRLRMGDFPLVTTAYPLGARSGEQSQVQFASIDGTDAAPHSVDVGDLAKRNDVATAARLPEGGHAAFVTLAAGDHPEVVETEPNNEAATATHVEVPAALSGRFDEPGDVDWYEFQATNGQRLTFQPRAASLGSPSHVYLRLFKADGSQVAESGGGPGEEERLSYTFGEDGTFRLAVEELTQSGGPEYTYRVSIDKSAGFALALKAENGRYQFLAPRGGVMAVDVQCQRDGYNGPVRLAAYSDDGPLTARNNLLREGQNEVRLLVDVPDNLPSGRHVAMHVSGWPVGDESTVVDARSTALLRAKFPQLVHPPSWLDGMLSAAGQDEAPPLFTALPQQPAVFVAQGSGQVQLTLVLHRVNAEFKDPLLVAADRLPAGVTPEVKRNGEGIREEYVVTLKTPGDMALGKHVFDLVGFGELAGRGQAAVSRVALEVVTPLTITTEVLGTLAQGGTQKVKVTAARFNAGQGGDRQPITLQWTKLPQGVTGPESITIAADQDAVEIELSAAGDAPVGKFDDSTLRATTKFFGQDVALEVKSAPIEVVAP
jgi:hypothetical protein